SGSTSSLAVERGRRKQGRLRVPLLLRVDYAWESMEDAEAVLRPGYRLDRYELLCPIASGGMASVWLARLRGKRGFEKLFAIKTVKAELIGDPRFQQMFLDEARLASAIQHPNVAQIIDLGEQDDTLYTVM